MYQSTPGSYQFRICIIYEVDRKEPSSSVTNITHSLTHRHSTFGTDCIPLHKTFLLTVHWMSWADHTSPRTRISVTSLHEPPLIYRLRKDGRLSWPRWLMIYRHCHPYNHQPDSNLNDFADRV